MAGLLPPDYRCSAFWYARNAGLDAGLEFLREFGARASRIARWYGVPEWPRQPEGPYWVLYWPEWVFDAAVSDMIWAYSQPRQESLPDDQYQVRAQVAQAYWLDPEPGSF